MLENFLRARAAIERLVARHQRSKRRCPSLKQKHVTPHRLRHTAAMQLLRHGIDRSVIALWLGHESVETTQIYLHADLRQKEEALAKVTPLDMPLGRFRPDDSCWPSWRVSDYAASGCEGLAVAAGQYPTVGGDRRFRCGPSA